MAIRDVIIQGGNGVTITKEIDSHATDFASLSNSTYYKDLGAGGLIYFKDSTGIRKKLFSFDEIEAYITDGTTITNLQNTANWSGATYTGPVISGTFAGQKHYDASYLFEAVADNLWVRWGRLGITSNIYTGDGTLTGARTVTMGGNALTFTGGQTTFVHNGISSIFRSTNATSSTLFNNSVNSDTVELGLSTGASIFYTKGTGGSSLYVANESSSIIRSTKSGNSISQFIVDNSITTSRTATLRQYNDNTTSQLIWENANGWAGASQVNLILNTSNQLYVLQNNINFGIGTAPTAKLHVVGSGTTSGTTALLVQNSGGTDLCKITDAGDIAIGRNASNTTTKAIAIGYNASVTGNGGVCVGNGVNSSPTAVASAVAIGQDSRATGVSSISIGLSSAASSQRSTSIGESTSASGVGSVAIGFKVKASALGSISLGYSDQATGGFDNTIARSLQIVFESEFQSFFINKNSNLVLNSQAVLTAGTHFEAAAKNAITIANGTAPTTSPADAFQMYSADITAGQAVPHFRTELGNIIKLYKETTAVSSVIHGQNGGAAITDTDTFAGYTIAQVVACLKNFGLL